jgi:ATP-dependent RNA helicase SUPV3L1/SUV3
VAFSRDDIFAIQREIEGATNHKCCIIYGSLPPEVRTAQAQLFNHAGSGYDVLVASDAIRYARARNVLLVILRVFSRTTGTVLSLCCALAWG